MLLLSDSSSNVLHCEALWNYGHFRSKTRQSHCRSYAAPRIPTMNLRDKARVPETTCSAIPTQGCLIPYLLKYLPDTDTREILQKPPESSRQQYSKLINMRLSALLASASVAILASGSPTPWQQPPSMECPVSSNI
jgi:hypothetical protein